MDRLALWGVARDRELARIDFGAVPARTSSEVPFRLKNLSHRYTAQSVTVAVGFGGGDLYLSADGQLYTASLAIGDLAPLATSDVFYLRRVTPSDAPIGDGNSRLTATCASWQRRNPPVQPDAPPLDIV